MVSPTALARAGHELGSTFEGMALFNVIPSARRLLEAFLREFGALTGRGCGLAFTGGQGTGKTACLALIAEACVRWLEAPKATPWESPRPVVRYTRMPQLARRLADFVPGRETDAWWSEYERLQSCLVLLIDEFSVFTEGDRAGGMLLDLIDYRVSQRLPVFVALNARWDALRDDQSWTLAKCREKLEGAVREIVIPGGSRRTAWELV